MDMECQLVTNGFYCGNGTNLEDSRSQELASGVKDWKLLIQIDSDQKSGMDWCDAGRLYYWIRTQDLLQERFDRAWMVLQCY